MADQSSSSSSSLVGSPSIVRQWGGVEERECTDVDAVNACNRLGGTSPLLMWCAIINRRSAVWLGDLIRCGSIIMCLLEAELWTCIVLPTCVYYISPFPFVFNSIKMCIPLIRKIVSWFGKWLTSGKGSHKISLYRNCAGTFNFARSPLIIISQPLASSSSDSYVCIAFAICLCFTR